MVMCLGILMRGGGEKGGHKLKTERKKNNKMLDPEVASGEHVAPHMQTRTRIGLSCKWDAHALNTIRQQCV
jgi:hypothetical protein